MVSALSFIMTRTTTGLHDRVRFLTIKSLELSCLVLHILTLKMLSVTASIMMNSSIMLLQYKNL